MFIDVAIPVPLHHPFTYEVPPDLRARVQPGMRVVVPFHRRRMMGIVLGPPSPSPSPRGGEGKQQWKPILDVLDEKPVIAPTLLKLLHWISSYYAAPVGEVCRAALPRSFFRQRTLPRSSRLPAPHTGDAAFHRDRPITLTAAQATAVAAVQQAIDRRTFTPFLLHGVTGSGKTEVYLQAIAHTLAAGRQALLLVPEIGLTPQLLSRVNARFSHQVAIYHSGLTEAQRVLQWQRMVRGEARICVGTRSALFAPFADIGCIVIDEEHDASYKQEESPRYHARDAAIVRAREERAVVLLGTATPALETFHNVRAHKYQYLTLPERATGVAPPRIEVIDLRRPGSNGRGATFLAQPLVTAIAETLEQREQVLLFFNRRGFAPVLLCRDCGHCFRCPNCEVSLTTHRATERLHCHYCEFATDVPRACPQCKAARLHALGAGTERLEQWMRAQFPAARIARFDRDTGSRRAGRETILTQMHRREIDILVGTQMIAKGHDFPDVGLVGIVDADLGLYLPDFRAAERTFQLLTQVAGRTGRAEKPGWVVIQTYTPEHYALRHVQQGGYAAFYDEERRHREALHYPPFGRLINIRITGNTETPVKEYAQILAQSLCRQFMKEEKSVAVLGPAPSPFKKLAGKFRWQLLIKTPSPASVPALTHTALAHAAAHAPRGVKCACDVDPVSLL
ncbi:MAG: primosomal protein N' [Deltaproteobacteria bacterium]|nr:primosomal protein N' [Deltaproteobacteria bacterium]